MVRPQHLVAESLTMDTLLQQLINGLTLGAVYALVALGYTMVYGICLLYTSPSPRD